MTPADPEDDTLGDLESVGRVVLHELAAYWSATRRGEAPVVSARPLGDVAERLKLDHWLTKGGMGPLDLAEFVSTYCALATNLNHARYMAHQTGAPDVPTMMADLVNAVTNNTPVVYEMGPGASAVDRAVRDWMLAKVGWADTGGGTLTGGGALGNVIALLAARTQARPDSWRAGYAGGLAVLAAETSHYSVRKAAAVLGLGESAVQLVPTDADGRIDPAGLPAALAEVRAGGRAPMALVATACHTSTGLYDPIARIADWCEREHVWLHVDGAHGASALLSPTYRGLLAGVERANSLSWDAHKMLRASLVCTGVLFRDAATFDGLFRQQAHYIFHDETVALDWGQRSLETTKPGLGLKLFLNLACRGEDGLRRYLEAQFEKAAALWRLLRDRPDFECPYRPDANVLCFRYRPAGAHQERIKAALRESGTFHLTTTYLDGEAFLRVTLMSAATTDADLTRLIDSVVECWSALAGERVNRPVGTVNQ